jgi:hypothetical protein
MLIIEIVVDCVETSYFPWSQLIFFASVISKNYKFPVNQPVLGNLAREELVTDSVHRQIQKAALFIAKSIGYRIFVFSYLPHVFQRL